MCLKAMGMPSFFSVHEWALILRQNSSFTIGKGNAVLIPAPRSFSSLRLFCRALKYPARGASRRASFGRKRQPAFGELNDPVPAHEGQGFPAVTYKQSLLSRNRERRLHFYLLALLTTWRLVFSP